MLFSVGEKVLCFHVGLLYEAKVSVAWYKPRFSVCMLTLPCFFDPPYLSACRFSKLKSGLAKRISTRMSGRTTLSTTWDGGQDVSMHLYAFLPVTCAHHRRRRRPSVGDEWVPESRMLKLNEDNLQKQKALLDSVKAAQEAKVNESVKGGRKSGGTAGAAARESSELQDQGDRRKTKESRGTKRGRDAVEQVSCLGEPYDIHMIITDVCAIAMLCQEEEYVKRPEIKLNVPDALKVRLVDDWEFVTKRSQLVPLPRKPNIDEILAMYRAHYLSVKKDHKASRPPAVLDEVLDGLRLYFDKALGNNLLYRFERAQYVQQRKAWAEAHHDGSEMEPSKVYGAEHLLRLFGEYCAAGKDVVILWWPLTDDSAFGHSQSSQHYCSHDDGRRVDLIAERASCRVLGLFGKGAKEVLLQGVRDAKHIVSPSVFNIMKRIPPDRTARCPEHLRFSSKPTSLSGSLASQTVSMYEYCINRI